MSAAQRSSAPATQPAQASTSTAVAARESRWPEVAALGDGSVWIRRHPDGAIKAVKGVVVLKEARGEIALAKGRWMITATGYHSLNRIAGLSIVTPPKLELPDGRAVVNPYPILDEASHTIRQVWVRKLAVGYGPIGNLVITSATLLYDVEVYFVQDLAGKIEKSKAAGRFTTEDQLTDEDRRKGIFVRIQGPFGVWANLEHPDVIQAVTNWIQTKLHAERRAQSICERLAMAKHPALAERYVEVLGTDKDHFTRVTVVGWVHDLTPQDVQRLAEQAQRGEVPEVRGQRAQVIDVKATASDEDAFVTEEEPDEAPEPEPQAPDAKEAPKGGLF